MLMRRVLAVVASCVLMWSVVGCRHSAEGISSKMSPLAKSVAAEPGVASARFRCTGDHGCWALLGDVTVADGTSADRQAELVPRILELAKQAGLSEDQINSMDFQFPAGGWFTTNYMVDAPVTEIVTLLDWCIGHAGVEECWAAEYERRKVNLNVRFAADPLNHVADVERTAQFLPDFPRQTQFDVSVGLSMSDVHSWIDYSAGRLPAANDLAFFAAMRGWVSRNPDVQFRLTFVPGRESTAKLKTKGELPDVVREFAKIARDHGQSITVTAEAEG